MIELKNAPEFFSEESYTADIKKVFKYYREIVNGEASSIYTPKEFYKLNTALFSSTDSYKYNPGEIEVANSYMNDTRKFELLKENGFIDQNTNKFIPVTYKCNRYGFRGPNFKSEDSSIVCLGCSDTFGLGQYEERTWPYLLSKKLNKPYWNLGVPGGDYSTFYRTLQIMVNEVKIDTVFLQGTFPYRKNLFFFNKDKYPEKTYISSGLSLYKDDFKKQKFTDLYFENVLLVPQQVTYEIDVHINAIANICKEHGIKFIYEFHPCWPNNEGEIEYKVAEIDQGKHRNLAADLAHLGTDFQNFIVNRFLKQI